MTTATGSTLGDFADDELVTGEAVAIDLPASGLGPRVLAALLDIMVATSVMGMLLTLVAVPAAASQFDAALGAAVMLVLVVGTLVGYPVTMETLSRGKTVGKIAAGIRTVRDDGGAIGFRHALTRGLVGFIETYLFFGVPAVMTALFTNRGKRLGDIAAGTYVIRERMGLRMAPAAQMPPFLASWAVAADITALPDSLALATRQFLGRAHTLTPEARRAIGEELYAELLRHVAPAPPAGIHPEYVMAAIIADRGRRDRELIARRDLAVTRLLPPDELNDRQRWLVSGTRAAVPGTPQDWAAPPSQPHSAAW